MCTRAWAIGGPFPEKDAGDRALARFPLVAVVVVAIVAGVVAAVVAFAEEKEGEGVDRCGGDACPTQWALCTLRTAGRLGGSR